MIELHVFMDGSPVTTVQFDDPEDAQAAAERWTELPGVTCQIDDASHHHGPEDILGGEVDLLLDEDLVGGPGQR
jgi:hypothetical protein